MLAKECNVIGYVIDEYARQATNAAYQAANSVSYKSKLINTSKHNNELPRFDYDEFRLGNLLGRGMFSDVYEVKGFNDSRRTTQANYISFTKSNFITSKTVLSDQSKDKNDIKGSMKISIKDDPLSDVEFEMKKFLVKHCLRDKSGSARYAVKFLKETVTGDIFPQAAADLVVESFLLRHLTHPNIIKIRGISGSGPAGFACPFNKGYFIIMDRLYDTLNKRIKTWSTENKKKKFPFTKNSSRKFKEEFLAVRLNVAFDIAGALQHLHKHDIIYRDLKPDNIGFDIRGDVKIFDFGLAKELRQDEMNKDETYHLSINTGTRRYMAPEVGKCLPYNQFADVYSFGVLLFEICHLQKPWKKYDYETHEERVIYGGERPTIDKSLPSSVQELLKLSWDESWTNRPDFDSVVGILKREITLLRKGNDSGLEHEKRRSTFVFKTPSNLQRTSFSSLQRSMGIRSLMKCASLDLSRVSADKMDK